MPDNKKKEFHRTPSLREYVIAQELLKNPQQKFCRTKMSKKLSSKVPTSTFYKTIGFYSKKGCFDTCPFEENGRAVLMYELNNKGVEYVTKRCDDYEKESVYREKDYEQWEKSLEEKT